MKNRIYKFRAWDQITGTMLYSDQSPEPYEHWFEISDTVKCGAIGDLIPSNDPLEPSEPETYLCENIMQFTGLLDKNGKEAFEGDIIKHGKSTGVIVFEDAKFKIEWTKNPEYWNDSLHYHCENIIGNKFENADLLNDLLNN